MAIPPHTTIGNHFPPHAMISLRAHEAVMDAMAARLGEYERERVRIVAVLDRWRREEVSLSSLQAILTLATDLCGPWEKKETR